MTDLSTDASKHRTRKWTDDSDGGRPSSSSDLKSHLVEKKGSFEKNVVIDAFTKISWLEVVLVVRGL